MAQATEADLKNIPSLYGSSRGIGDILLGKDVARKVIKACSTGDDAALQSLLSQPEWDKIMLEKAHGIYSEDRPSKGPGDELVAAYPNIIHTQIAHGVMPLYEAVNLRQTAVVAVLFELGADPTMLYDDLSRNREAHARLMAHACLSRPPMIQMLVERGLPIAGTHALHAAAQYGMLNNMRTLIKHSANVNEPHEKQRTPMHYAASSGQTEAMELLEELGARLDVEDEDGKTPEQLLEEHQNVG